MTTLTDTQKRVMARAAEFDLLPLLQLLVHIGYSRDQIRFASSHTCVSQASLVREVSFQDDPRLAIVRLNMGLLGPQSPLPSYFFKKMESATVTQAGFEQFLGFFDHLMLSDYVRTIYPELDARVFPDWEEYKLRELQMLNLRSTATLHWMLGLVFPELEIRIEKVIAGRAVDAGQFALGRGTLGGDAVMGRSVEVPVLSRQVTLVPETERTPLGVPWPREARERLNKLVFPVLASVGVDLTVYLEVYTERTYARLQGGSYLGYDRIKGQQATYRRIKIVSGYISD